ncbi:MAG: hypothetical protein ACFBZ9_12715 [Sphingomonadales bacterium]
MSPIQGNGRWLAPFRYLNAGFICLAAALAGVLSFDLIALPAPILTYVGCALCASLAILNTLWVSRAIVRPLKQHRHELFTIAEEGPAAQLQRSHDGLRAVLGDFARATRDIERERVENTPSAEQSEDAILQTVLKKMDAVSEQIDSNEGWWRERQDTLKDVHVKIAEQSLGAAQALQSAADSQQELQQDMRVKLTELEQAVSVAQEPLAEFARLDIEALAQSADRMIEVADAMQQAGSDLQSSATSADTAASQLDDAVQKLGSHGDEYSRMVTEATEAAQAAATTLESTMSGLEGTNDQVTGFIETSKKSLVSALQGVVSAGRDINGVAEKSHADLALLEEAVQGLIQSGKTSETEMATLLQKLEETVQQNLSDNQTAVEGALQTASEDMQQIVLSISQNLEGVVGDIETAFEETLKEMPTTAQQVFEKAVADVTDMSKAHKEMADKELGALAELSAVLEQSRSAATAVTAAFEILEGQSQAASDGFQSQLALQKERLDEMALAAAPLADKIAELTEVDGQRFAATCADVEVALQHLRETEGRSFDTHFAALSEALENTHSDIRAVSEQVLQLPSDEQLKGDFEQACQELLERLTAQSAERLQETQESQQALKERVEALGSKVAKEMNALGVQLKDGDETGTLLQDLETGIMEKFENLAQTMENLHTEQRKTSLDHGDGVKSLRSLLRKTADKIAKSQDGLSDEVRQLRANQIQALKQIIRAIPSNVLAEIHPILEGEIKTVREAVLALPSAVDTAADVPDTPAEPEQENPDALLATLSERLRGALDTMNEIESEVTALAVAALAAPERASDSTDFTEMLIAAESALSNWHSGLENISTAIALARDAA